MADASSYWKHLEPSSYQIYHGQDPLTGTQDYLGMSTPNVPQNPGGDVGAAQPDTGYALQKVPGTNYSYNPMTGQYYQSTTIDPRTGQAIDMGATSVAAAPNLAQQGSGAAINQQTFLQQQADAVARMQATRAGQVGLQTDYQGVIRGAGPSVANAQLYSGMNRIAQDQASQAAGANGQNAFAARRIAAQNTAHAQGDLSGQAAQLRAQEVAAARTGLASLYGNEASADAAANSTATGAAVNYGALGEKAENDRVAANQAAVNANLQASKQDNETKMGIAKGAGSVLGAIFGG